MNGGIATWGTVAHRTKYTVWGGYRGQHAGVEEGEWCQQNQNLTFLRVSGVDLSVHDITDVRPGFADLYGLALSLLPCEPVCPGNSKAARLTSGT